MIVEIKRRNPNFGYQRITDQISLVFDVEIDKDLVQRVLATHYKPEPGSNGPSWLSFLGHSKDSLWSVDLFRCDSLTLKSHWVMVVMDQFTRQIIGFAIHSGPPDGPGVCRMFDSIVSGSRSPQYLSSDNDPLFRYQQWNANLRILEVTEVKAVPYVPMSHPFVERLIRTIRREYLDRSHSGLLLNWRGNYGCTRNTTTEIVPIKGSTAPFRIRNATEWNESALVWIPFNGGIIVAAYISCRKQPDL